MLNRELRSIFFTANGFMGSYSVARDLDGVFWAIRPLRTSQIPSKESEQCELIISWLSSDLGKIAMHYKEVPDSKDVETADDGYSAGVLGYHDAKEFNDNTLRFTVFMHAENGYIVRMSYPGATSFRDDPDAVISSDSQMDIVAKTIIRLRNEYLS